MDKRELIELKQLIKENRYLVHGDPSTADCVLGFSFGYRIEDGKVVPGKSNEQIANYIEKNFSNKTLMLQFEIADALEGREADFIITKNEDGSYLSSLDVIKKAKLIMDREKLKKAIIVTHPGLESRNDYMCTAYDIKTVAPSGLEEIDFDEKSEQYWTRSLKSWVKKEVEDTIDDKFERNLLEKPAI